MKKMRHKKKKRVFAVNNGINILSLFNGMSGARFALEEAELKVGEFYSSEIDRHTNKIAFKNFPEDEKNALGDMTKLTYNDLKDLKIDLLIGGSSCIDFSSIGKKKGMQTEDEEEITSLKQYLKLKSSGVEFTGESYLYFEFLRIMNIIKPKYFLLENVKMQKRWVALFEEHLGVKGVIVNSDLLTAQNRERYYFTNISFEKPEDKNINIQDILMDGYEKIVADKVEYDGIEYELDKSIKPQIRSHIINNIKQISECDKNFHTMKIGVTNGWADAKIALKKSMTLRAKNNAAYVLDIKNKLFRRVTPEEREILQGFKAGVTEGVVDTQRVKMLGNGFTIPIVAHILKNIR